MRDYTQHPHSGHALMVVMSKDMLWSSHSGIDPAHPPNDLMILLACCCQGEGCRVSGPKPAGSESFLSFHQAVRMFHSIAALPPTAPPPPFLSDSEMKTTDHWNRIEAILFSALSIIHIMFIVFILFILLIVVLFSLLYCTVIYLFLDHFAIVAPWVQEDWNVVTHALCLDQHFSHPSRLSRKESSAWMERQNRKIKSNVTFFKRPRPPTS